MIHDTSGAFEVQAIHSQCYQSFTSYYGSCEVGTVIKTAIADLLCMCASYFTITAAICEHHCELVLLNLLEIPMRQVSLL